MDSPKPDKNQSITNPRTITKLTLLAVIGVGASWLASQKNFREILLPNINAVDLKPQQISGLVAKTLEQFSLTSVNDHQYHIADPSNYIDGIAKQRGIESSLYELENTCITGVISKVGNYGHMGRFERQITVTGLCKD